MPVPAVDEGNTDISVKSIMFSVFQTPSRQLSTSSCLFNVSKEKRHSNTRRPSGKQGKVLKTVSRAPQKRFSSNQSEPVQSHRAE